MSRDVIGRGNVRFIVATTGLILFYGSLTSLILRLYGAKNATEIGVIVALGTAILGTIVGAYAAVYLMPRDGKKRRFSPLATFFSTPFIIATAILAAPFVIMTGGWVWRWLTGKTKEKQPRP